MTLIDLIPKAPVVPLAISLLVAASSCGSHGAGDSGARSELDSLRSLQQASGGKVTNNSYDRSLPDGTPGRHMHRIAAAEILPVACCSGEILEIKSTARGRCNISVYNATEKRLLGSREVNPEIEWNIPIEDDGIYALQITPVNSVGGDVPSAAYSISFSGDVMAERPTVAVNLVTASKNDFMAYPTMGLQTSDVFKAPKRIALRGHMKAALSGYSRGIVTVPVPEGTDLLAYSLRVSNNENSVGTDGKFSNRLTSSYNKVKILGIPVYEGSAGFNLGSLLFDARPPREDDAFCNLFVFDDATGARQFQNSTGDASTFNYNVDLSQIGTQSCTGELPCAGRSNIYLGFENERMRYDTYIWLEVTAIKHRTEYLKPEFSIRHDS